MTFWLLLIVAGLVLLMYLVAGQVSWAPVDRLVAWLDKLWFGRTPGEWVILGLLLVVALAVVLAINLAGKV